MRNFAIIQLNDGAVRGPAKKYVSPPPYIPLPFHPLCTTQVYFDKLIVLEIYQKVTYLIYKMNKAQIFFICLWTP